MYLYQLGNLKFTSLLVLHVLQKKLKNSTNSGRDLKWKNLNRVFPYEIL